MELKATLGPKAAQRRRSQSSDRGPAADPADRAAAVTALYAEHSLTLVRLAHIMLGSPAAAEDVVQEAFCGLFRRWHHLDDPDRALGYLRASVLNGCRTALRRRRAIEFTDSHEAPACSAESTILRAETRREVVGALRGLPQRQREVLALRYFLDLTDEQIGAVMGIGRGTVRSAAHRGIARLRRTLTEES